MKFQIKNFALLFFACLFFMGSSSAKAIDCSWAAEELSTAEEFGLLKNISLKFENGVPIPSEEFEILFQTLTEKIEEKTGQQLEFYSEYRDKSKTYITRGESFLYILDYIQLITGEETVYPSWYPFADKKLKQEEELAGRFLFSRGIVKGVYIPCPLPQLSEIWLLPQQELTYTEAVLLALRIYQCAPDFLIEDSYPQAFSMVEVKEIFVEYNDLFEQIKEEMLSYGNYAYIFPCDDLEAVATLYDGDTYTPIIENGNLEQFFALFPSGTISRNGENVSLCLMGFPLRQQITYYPNSFDLDPGSYSFIEQYAFSDYWKYEYVLPPD